MSNANQKQTKSVKHETEDVLLEVNNFADSILKNVAVSVKEFPKIIFNFNPKTLHKATGDVVEVYIKVKMPCGTGYHDFIAAWTLLTEAVASRHLSKCFKFFDKDPTGNDWEYGTDPFSLYKNCYFISKCLDKEGSMLDPQALKIAIPGTVIWNGYEWVVSYKLLTEILDFILTSPNLVRVG